MNIFYLDTNPALCAEYHCDKHVLKMIIEYAQLLSTAHRILDGEEVKVLSNSGKQMVTLGLKSIWTDTIKKEANSLLSNSDWYITRKSEKNTEIPNNVLGRIQTNVNKYDSVEDLDSLKSEFLEGKK